MRIVPYMPLSMTTNTIAQPVLHGRGELLSVHQEAAVAVPRDDCPLRMVRSLRGDGRRHAVAHRAGVGCELPALPAVAIEAMQPRRVIACAVREDRVVGQRLVQPADDLPQVDDRPARRAARATCSYSSRGASDVRACCERRADARRSPRGTHPASRRLRVPAGRRSPSSSAPGCT